MLTRVDHANCNKQGFTLIELSIVLVIIGLLVGGILVGRDLINAATIRAQISQIDKYQTAVKTFRLKYNALPGDLTNDTASQFGFWTTRGTGVHTGGPLSNPAFADGDGNGVIEAVCSGNGPSSMSGETSMFWNDLGVAQLIEGRFSQNTDASVVTIEYGGALPTSAYLPQAQIGNGNYIVVWSGGYGIDGGYGGTGGSTSPAICGSAYGDSTNYFAIVQMPHGLDGGYGSAPGLTSIQAYAIDTKMDDGLPQPGRVIAMYTSFFDDYPVEWAEGPNASYGSGESAQTLTPPIPATPGDANTCYDNSTTGSGTPGVANGVQHYFSEIKSSNYNCALSFRFQ